AISKKLDFRQRRIALRSRGIANPLDDLTQQETAIGDSSPVSAREYTNTFQIIGTDFRFVPHGVFRQFAPHMSAASIKQRTADRILTLVGQVRIKDQALELFPIAVIFLLVELVFQKLGQYFRFSNAAFEDHAASFHRRLLMERKNGRETTSSIR